MISVGQLGTVMEVIQVMGDARDECDFGNTYVVYFVDAHVKLVRYYGDRQPARLE